MSVVFEFEKLEVYRAAKKFRARVNKLVVLLPKDEEYRLKSQMRRVALSITNCLAEGHGRYSFKDRMHFCHESRGSLQEVVDDISECADLSYARNEHLEDLRNDAHRLLQLIDGYIRYLRKQHTLIGPRASPKERVTTRVR